MRHAGGSGRRLFDLVFLGGTLVQFIGFEAIGYAAILFVIVQLICFNQTRRIVTGGIPTISAESEVSP